jgi:anthranilate synthase component I
VSAAVFQPSSDLIVQPIQAGATVMLDLHATDPRRYPALLESAARTQAFGRFDILFAFPEDEIRLSANGQLEGEAGSGFLDALDRRWRHEQALRIETTLPFSGGWLVYLGYELAGEIEPRLSLPRGEGTVARALRVPAALIFDHEAQALYAVAEYGREDLIEALIEDVHRSRTRNEEPFALIESFAEEDPARYLQVVRTALDYIRAGDIYQANLSRGWRAIVTSGVSAADIYRQLRIANPGPFNGIAQFDDMSVISASPERLVAVRDGVAATRPIAGTRPRGADVVADQALVHELRTNAKEQAEHVMLIDLERNDLGRVCEAGSVRVDEYMTIESYAHVHHIVSNVTGRLRRDVTPGQILAATFPGGTITGCPKVRCMEIIGELEGVARGAYTGSLGYLNRDGTMDFNILIRSLEQRGNELHFRTGAGIVADSIPERELDETRAKARGTLRALRVDSQS